MSVFDNSAKLAASWEGVLGTSRQHNQITAHRKRIAKQQGKKNANMAFRSFMSSSRKRELSLGDKFN